ncbi:MAG: efflux RND transporter periplasmic adaptor subunit [Planctomycetes bacterium]|nr:efflux RND transporter periplasmic adaptor subunit [Planctomycetota bacterium]
MPDNPTPSPGPGPAGPPSKPPEEIPIADAIPASPLATPPPPPQEESASIFNILMVRLRFIFVFIVVGLIVGNWGYIMNTMDRWTRPEKGADLVESEFEWFCPMHPSVIRKDASEKCPICGMPLSRRKRGEKTELDPGILSRLQLSPFRIRQAGLATEEVGYRTLVREVRTVGSIAFDERRLSHVTARIPGRIDRLFVDFTGTTVKKGEPLVWLYSPELVTTQEEVLLGLKALEEIRSKPGANPAAVDRAQRLVDASLERLRLWGVTDGQIENLRKTGKAEIHLELLSTMDGTVIQRHLLSGQYVETGMGIYTLADLTAVWMQAEVFERDIGLVRIGQMIEVTSEAYPGESFVGKVAFVQPTLDPETRTVKVRVDVDNPGGKLKPGMYVAAALRIPLGKEAEVWYGCCPMCPEVRSDEPGICEKCGMELVRKGVATADGAPAPSDGGTTAAAKEVFYQCPMHAEVTSDKPGRCPKCNMELAKREASVEKPRTIYVCDMHPEKVSDIPGECAECGGMILEPRTIEPGSRLMYVCAEHPDVRSDKPGTCPREKCGKALRYKIESPGKRLVDAWICPLHPDHAVDPTSPCPDCARPTKHMEFEQVLAVPVSAVIDNGLRKVVYLEKGQGTFDAVEVVLGPRAGEYVQVLKGLAAGDRAVTAGSFLPDAEARLNPAAGAQYFGASGAETSGGSK